MMTYSLGPLLQRQMAQEVLSMYFEPNGEILLGLIQVPGRMSMYYHNVIFPGPHLSLLV